MIASTKTPLQDRVASQFPVVHRAPGPVHVLGHGRSGTSIFSAICRVHLGIGIATESQFILRMRCHLHRFEPLSDDKNLRRLVHAILEERYFKRSAKFGVHVTTDQVLRQLRQRTYSGILDTIFSEVAKQVGCPRWGDKSPTYAEDLPAILDLFPNSQFIHIVRDGRDVALSAMAHPRSGIKNTVVAARDWRRSVERIQQFGDQLGPEKFVTIRYEDLLDDPQSVLAKLIPFLQIDDRGGELLEYATAQIEEELMHGNHSKWKQAMSARQIHDFDSIAGNLLAENGYSTSVNTSRNIGAIESLISEAHNSAVQWCHPQYWAVNLHSLKVKLKDLRS